MQQTRALPGQTATVLSSTKATGARSKRKQRKADKQPNGIHPVEEVRVTIHPPESSAHTSVNTPQNGRKKKKKKRRPSSETSPTPPSSETPQSESGENEDCQTRMNSILTFLRAFGDTTVFIADLVDICAGYSPQFLGFSWFGFGAGCGVAVALALAEYYCHKNLNLTNQPGFPAVSSTDFDGVSLSCGYKAALAGHFASDMFDWAGAATMAAYRVRGSTLSLRDNFIAKGVGVVAGGLWAIAENRTVYQALRKLSFLNRKTTTVPEFREALLPALR